MRERRLRAEALMEEGRALLRQHPLVGLRVDEAGRLVREAGITFLDLDVARPIRPGDVSPGRITVMVKDGVVVRADVGS